MRNVFIDCGANLGHGFNRISSQRDLTNYEVHMFEPLPNAVKLLKERYPKATVYCNAVWINEEEKVFEIEDLIIDGVQSVGHASNIMAENYQKNKNIQANWTKITTKCVDLANFITSNFSKEDNIFLKLDVEGAEYSILDKFISLNILDFIKTINVEFHGHLLNTQPNPDSYYLEIIKQHNIELF